MHRITKEKPLAFPPMGSKNKIRPLSDEVPSAPAASTYTVLNMEVLGMEKVYAPGRYNQSVQNQENGLRVRILPQRSDSAGVVEAKEEAIKELHDFVDTVVKRRFHKTRKTDFDTFMTNRGYTGAKRQRYEIAKMEYDLRGLSAKDAYVSAFIKDENQHPDTCAVKEPRIVQSRGYPFALTFGQHLEQIEHQVYGQKGWSTSRDKLPVFGKGHSPLKRGSVIKHKMRQFLDCEVTMFDLTAFDSTIKTGLLKAVHKIYKHCSSDEEFVWLMEQQLTTTGFTKNFAYFVGDGGRCSGDFDTSVGNALIMAMCLELYCRKQGWAFDMYCDGDDTLLFTERGVLDHEDISRFYRDLGMILRVEGVAHEIEQINWCQCHPVFVRGKYRMVPNPWKRISHSLSSPKMCGPYMKALALAETQIQNGVPILGAFAQLLDRSSQGYVPGTLEQSQVYQYKNALRSYGNSDLRTQVSVSDETRLSFFKAFGITADEQMAYEMNLDGCLLDPSQASAG